MKESFIRQQYCKSFGKHRHRPENKLKFQHVRSPKHHKFNWKYQRYDPKTNQYRNKYSWKYQIIECFNHEWNRSRKKATTKNIIFRGKEATFLVPKITFGQGLWAMAMIANNCSRQQSSNQNHGPKGLHPISQTHSPAFLQWAMGEQELETEF